MQNVLIVEDDIDIAEIESDYLKLAGFNVTVAGDGKTGLNRALNEKFDCIVLDLMLPEIDGLQILRQIRDKIATPVIMVTAKSTDADKIRGYLTGADDYVEKPFSPSVLVARIKAHIEAFNRRAGQGATPDGEDGVLESGDIKINLLTRRVYKNGVETELKNKEFELLAFFMKNKGVVFGKEQLYVQIWGMDAIGDNATVAVHVNRLREKLETDPEAPQHILTVRGAGYRFE